MNEINLRLKTIKINCEKRTIKTKYIKEEGGTPEIVIPKKIRKKIKKDFIKELENEKNLNNQ